MNAMTFAQSKPSGRWDFLGRDVRFGDRIALDTCHSATVAAAPPSVANRIRCGAVRKDADQLFVAPDRAATQVGGKAELAE